MAYTYMTTHMTSTYRVDLYMHRVCEHLKYVLMHSIPTCSFTLSTSTLPSPPPRTTF